MCDCFTTLVQGVVGITRALVSPAGADVVAARRDLCRECPEATRTTRQEARFVAAKGLTTASRCLKCNCFIAMKTMDPAAICPLGKWGKS